MNVRQIFQRVLHRGAHQQEQPAAAPDTEALRYFSRIRQLVNVDSGDSIAMAASLAEKDEQHRALDWLEPVQAAWQRAADENRPQGAAYEATRGACLSRLNQQMAAIRSVKSAPDLIGHQGASPPSADHGPHLGSRPSLPRRPSH